MSFSRHCQYKESSVEWLGQVPAHWQVTPLKWQVERNDGGVWGDEPDGTNDTIVLRSTEQTVDGYWRMDDPAPRNLSASEKQATLLLEGDLVVTKSSGSSLHIGKTTLVTPEIAAMGCCYSNFMQRLRMKATFNSRLAWYIMNSEIARLQFDLLSNSTTGLANLNATMLGQVLVAVPPPEEQVAIADFLDHETSKIDALVDQQKRLIDLLKEKRQAVISRAVTKGLNPDVPMKDTGVGWLGRVPTHWHVVPLMWLTQPDRPIMYGIVLPGPDVGEGVPILKGGNVRPSRLRLEALARTTPDIEAPYARARLRSGDLVYSIRGTIGDCEAVPAELDGCNITQDVARIAPAVGVNATWLRFALLSEPVAQELACGSLGAAVRGVNIFDLKRARIPVPPHAEQNAIADRLSLEVQRADALEQAAAELVVRLVERRSVLISAAVTGKIDVRGWQPDRHELEAA